MDDCSPLRNSSGRGFRWIESLAQTQTALNQGGQIAQRDHVRSIAESLIGPGMRLQKESVASRRHSRSRQVWHHTTITATLVSRAAWHLYAVSGVKDHGITQILHPRDRTHVTDQRVVAEGRAALRQQQAPIAHYLHFVDN